MPTAPWMMLLLDWYHSVMEGHTDGALAESHRARKLCWRLARTSGLRITRHSLDRFRERFGMTAERREVWCVMMAVVCNAEPANGAPWVFGSGAEPWTVGPVRLVVRNRNIVTVLPLEGA
jgi:hypothetical protein